MEERRLREEALKYQARAQSNASTSSSPDAAPAEQKEVADFQNAREAVEKLWAEKGQRRMRHKRGLMTR